MKSISYKKDTYILNNRYKLFSIKDNVDFKRLYRQGRKKGSGHIVVYTKENKLGLNRLGITVGKKFGNSVQRNRMKRLIREVYRLYNKDMTQGYDIIIAARPSVRSAASPNNRLKAERVPGYSDIESDFKKAFISLDMLRFNVKQ